MTTKDYSTYERVVSEIARSIYESVEGILPEAVQYGRGNRFLGRSGYAHQIDVSIRGGNNVILIECKYWSKKVSADAVLAFSSRVIDIREAMPEQQIHPVFVTRRGVQKGARQLAQYFDIDVQEIASESQFGFSYKNLVLIRPRPAVLTLSAGPAVVIVGERPSISGNETVV